jgi:carboxylesterase type B
VSDIHIANNRVKDHISLVGGDPDKVTAMGQSAGAGSIMHHLVGQGGKLDPLFSKAVLLSPAFEILWDRSGTVQKTFENFADLAGCAGQGLQCLRAAESDKLVDANTALMKQQFSGTFAVGPTTDGSFIRQLPVLELSSGNFWNMESLILSHTADESKIFTSGLVQTDAEFHNLINNIFPNYTQAAGITDKIASFYPPPGTANSPFKSQTDRVEALLRDSSFTCNVRHLTESVGDSKVWNFQYSVTPGWHATDLFPIFYTVKYDGKTFLERAANLFLAFLAPLIAGYSRALQSYLTSYTITGDPNTNRKVLNVPPTIKWPHPSSQGEQILGVVDLGNWGFSTVNDDQDKKTPCDFWREVAAAVTSLGGYSAPGAVVPQNLVAITEDASRNFKGGNI